MGMLMHDWYFMVAPAGRHTVTVETLNFTLMESGMQESD